MAVHPSHLVVGESRLEVMIHSVMYLLDVMKRMGLVGVMLCFISPTHSCKVCDLTVLNFLQSLRTHWAKPKEEEKSWFRNTSS